MSRLLFTLFLTCGVSILSAQEIPDISGEWNGSATIPLASDELVTYYFEQHGALITGYSTNVNFNGKDSAKAVIKGSLRTKVIKLKQTEFVYKTSLVRCLANVKLTYSVENGQEKLVGRWSGDMSLKTCPPGATGKVELVKIKKKVPVMAPQGVETVETVPIDEATDMYGVALTEELQKRKYHALLIGIESYDDDAIQDLNEPLSDLDRLANVLQTHYDFKPENTVVLKNPVRDDIIDAFDGLTERVEERDQLLIFYAGHGIWDENLNQGYWLPADARENSKARWLSNSTIRDYIGGINSKHTLLVTDACFSGSIFKERGVRFLNGRAMFERYKLPSRKAMTSGALKTVPDKSVFVEYMLKNLVNNTQPMISAEDLFNSFKTAVINNSANGQVPQYGAIGQVGDEGGDFIFLRAQTN